MAYKHRSNVLGYRYWERTANCFTHWTLEIMQGYALDLGRAYAESGYEHYLDAMAKLREETRGLLAFDHGSRDRIER